MTRKERKAREEKERRQEIAAYALRLSGFRVVQVAEKFATVSDDRGGRFFCFPSIVDAACGLCAPLFWAGVLK